MSNEFGYIPESPEQSFGNNKGIFTPTDIYDLTRADKYTNYGQLELLQTQTISSATADFTSLQETKYNVHFFTFTDVHIGSQSEIGYKISSDGGSSFNAGAPFAFANQRGIANGTFAERVSTGQASGRLCGDIDAGAQSLANGYMYLYNAGDSENHTMSTSHFVFVDNSDIPTMEFGFQMYEGAPKYNNGIRFGLGTTTTALTSATISCYGIKAY